MPARCQAANCSNLPDKERGITLHPIPFHNDERLEAKRRRKRWVDWVKLKRARWEPTMHSCICSFHFTPESFQRKIFTPGTSRSRRLVADELGVAAFPTIHATEDRDTGDDVSNRARRQIIRDTLAQVAQPSTSTAADAEVCQTEGEVPIQEKVWDDSVGSNQVTFENVSIDQDDPLQNAKETPTNDCSGCSSLSNQNRIHRNKVLSLRHVITRQRRLNRKLLRKVKRIQSPKKHFQCVDAEGDSCADDGDESDSSSDDGESDLSMEEEEEYEVEDQEMVFEPTTTETEESDDYETEDEGEILQTNTNLRMEPKFIVFLTQILALFKFCYFCKAPNPTTEASHCGTMLTVKSTCINPTCMKEFTWRSQPKMPETRISAGNFLLNMATLLAGGSISKILQICKHMGLRTVSLATFFKHQKTKLFPTIYIYWKTYQSRLLERMKESTEPIILSGDARHDSMGHNAKYGAYSIYSNTLSSIVHFDLVQKNQAGSSNSMEFFGFKKSLSFLLDQHVNITKFVSDRHLSIAAFMRDTHPEIKHRFDLWHIAKKITKVLTKLGKENEMGIINDWIQNSKKHLYWSATSTKDENGKVILAKFKSFLSHIVNKHVDLPDPLFNKCHHGPKIQDRKWLVKDSPQHEKLQKALLSPSLLKGIEQVSSDAQTSSLEGFHSVLNHFAPKMICFSYVGMMTRMILAITHFNHNINREVKRRKDGTTRMKVSYPKFKNGEATVRDVRVIQNFDYIEDIYQTLLRNLKRPAKLNEATDELIAMTPKPMNSMLEKQSKPDAIQKLLGRRALVNMSVPPTTPVDEVAAAEHAAEKTIRKPRCAMCNHPMKGHKQVKDCPKNRKT